MAQNKMKQRSWKGTLSPYRKRRCPRRRSFTRQWELPEDVDVEQVRSTLSEDGHLAVEALKMANLAVSGRDIPIQTQQLRKERRNSLQRRSKSSLPYLRQLNNFRSFTRQWELPEDVDVEQVRSTLSEDGRLAVEASKMANLAVSGRDIPIQRSITE
ncbi:hypothetical protein ANCDUO_16878 [Ancylostoma duodenale]|uniref:SHSP domain-containing protein n=1 Tax=Ancylostoma duodenale TaxID=51022 RepID=A0A0C2FWR6_9BILA|nr:hypothetical protein ANCDUO_16878 [Ancylostoma duodenale]